MSVNAVNGNSNQINQDILETNQKMGAPVQGEARYGSPVETDESSFKIDANPEVLRSSSPRFRNKTPKAMQDYITAIMKKEGKKRLQRLSTINPEAGKAITKAVNKVGGSNTQTGIGMQLALSSKMLEVSTGKPVEDVV